MLGTLNPKPEKKPKRVRSFGCVQSLDSLGLRVEPMSPKASRRVQVWDLGGRRRIWVSELEGSEEATQAP